MASVNKVILVGNLGRDPEIRTTQSGNKIANLTMATSESWQDKRTGERTERTEWHRVVIFNERLVRIAENHLKKGSKLYIEGELRTRKWTDKQGIERFTTEIVLQFQCALVMLTPKADDTQASQSEQPTQSSEHRYQAGTSMSDAAGYGTTMNDDDEIPF